MAGSGHPCRRDHEGYPPRGSGRERRGRREGGGPGAAEEEGGRPDKAPETGLETEVPKDWALQPRLSTGAGQGTRHTWTLKRAGERPKYSGWVLGEPDLNASGSEGRPAVGSPDPGGEGRAGGTHGGCTVTPAGPTMSTCQGRGMLSCPCPLHQGDPTLPEQQVGTCRAPEPTWQRRQAPMGSGLPAWKNLMSLLPTWPAERRRGRGVSPKPAPLGSERDKGRSYTHTGRPGPRTFTCETLDPSFNSGWTSRDLEERKPPPVFRQVATSAGVVRGSPCLPPSMLTGPDAASAPAARDPALATQTLLYPALTQSRSCAHSSRGQERVNSEGPACPYSASSQGP